MDVKEAVEISKCLSNKTRMQIMEWLREPEKNFPPHVSIDHFDDGVCATYIFEKSRLSQSTISNYLTSMEKCGLLVMTRHGKWSYFKRNEAIITEFAKYLL